MPRKCKPGSARIDLDISVDARNNFLSLHESLGLKTKAETFETILCSVARKHSNEAPVLERIEHKLDRVLELFHDVI